VCYTQVSSLEKWVIGLNRKGGLYVYAGHDLYLMSPVLRSVIRSKFGLTLKSMSWTMNMPSHWLQILCTVIVYCVPLVSVFPFCLTAGILIIPEHYISTPFTNCNVPHSWLKKRLSKGDNEHDNRLEERVSSRSVAQPQSWEGLWCKPPIVECLVNSTP